MKLILTCEHATNLLPSSYHSLFKNEQDLLNTHEGFDIGAFEVYKSLQNLAHYSLHYPWSRLLIEINRSLHHPNLFSIISKKMDKAEKNRIITNYYEPYRNQIQQKIKESIDRGEQVLHLSIHSFTPILNGYVRETDLGILYDPRRNAEKDWVENFRKELSLQFGQFRIRMNYPYLGKADGFTTSLRTKFTRQYLGIELEINQKLFKNLDETEAFKLKLNQCLIANL